MSVVNYPTLYKKNSKGKIQEWNISVEHAELDLSVIITVHGEQGGKMQTNPVNVTKGKNKGKANETSVHEQAELEAKAKWQKQIDRKGYKEDITKLDIDERPGAEAMLAHRYDKFPDKIAFPCFIQPKFDGHRCIAVVKEGKCELFSRQRKPITGLPHIQRALEDLVGGDADYIFDGELYNHDFKDNFEELTGFIRSQEPKEGHEVVQLHIYDMVFPGKDYEARVFVIEQIEREYHRLIEVEDRFPSDALQFVPSLLVEQDQVVSRFKNFLEQGYEGAMLRNLLGGYEGKRSYNLQKVKQFQDAEFDIVDVVEGKGKMEGHAIFVCHTAEGKEFRAKMKGDMDHLIELYEDRENLIGREVVVQFQDWTKDGIPRFPVALRLREDV